MKKVGKKILLCAAWLMFFNFFALANASPKELDTVKVYYKQTIGQAPAMIALEEGFFQEQGIKAELVELNASSKIWLLLIGGAVDVSFGAISSAVYSAVALQKNIKLVAGSNNLVKGNKSEGLGIRNDTKNKSDIPALIRNLKGKKVGIFQSGSFTHYLVDVLFKENGLSIKDVELVIMPLFSMVQALEGGVLDAGILAEPFASILRIKDKDKFSIVPYGDISPGSPVVFMMFGERLLVEDPELGVRFMAAWLKGVEKYNEGKTKRNIEIIRKYTDLDEEMLQMIDWTVVSPDGIYNSAQILNDYQDWLIEGNFIDKKISVDSLIDTSFLERAKKIVK
jgi:NitT/TauT family transport system substrate-binding protein